MYTLSFIRIFFDIIKYLFLCQEHILPNSKVNFSSLPPFLLHLACIRLSILSVRGSHFYLQDPPRCEIGATKFSHSTAWHLQVLGTGNIVEGLSHLWGTDGGLVLDGLVGLVFFFLRASLINAEIVENLGLECHARSNPTRFHMYHSLFDYTAEKTNHFYKRLEWILDFL